MEGLSEKETKGNSQEFGVKTTCGRLRNQEILEIDITGTTCMNIVLHLLTILCISFGCAGNITYPDDCANRGL